MSLRRRPPVFPIVLLSTLVLGSPHLSSAQPRPPGEADGPAAGHDLQGVITDGAQLPVPGVVVVLRTIAAGLQRSVRTDATGRFVFRAVTPGAYDVIATIAGFAPAQARVEAPAARPIALSLTPEAYAESLTIVSDARADRLRDTATSAVTVIGGDAMRSASYETVADALGEVAGVVTRRGSEGTAAAGEQIQGIDSRQVLVLVDGQPVAGARGVKSGIVNLDREPARGLDRIEIVKGAASALYGSEAMGGVINLIPRAPRRPLEVAASAAGGSHEAGDVSADLGAARSWGTIFFTGGRHRRDEFDLTPTTTDTTGAAFDRADAAGRVMATARSAWLFTGNMTSYWNSQRGRSIGELGPQDDLTRAKAQTYAGRASRQFGARTSLDVRGYFGRYDETADATLLDPGRTRLTPGHLFQGLFKTDATLGWFVGNRHQFRAGAEWSRDEYRGDNRIRDDEGNAVSTSVAWAHYDFSAFGPLTLTAGLRYDDHSEFGGAVSPKVAALAKVTERVTARASFARGFRAPDVGQLYYRFLNPTNQYQVIGNPLLEPERSAWWQAGIDRRLSARSRIGINLFHNEVSNLIEASNLGFISSPGQLAQILEREGIDPTFDVQLNRLLFLYKNISRVTTRGVELQGDIRFGASVRVAGSYAYLDAVNAETGADLADRNPHHGAIRLDWTPAARGIKANLRGAFYSSWIVSSTRGAAGTTTTRAQEFALWDLTVAKALARGAELFGAVDNLTDSQDPNTGVLSPIGAPLPIYRPEIGRTFRFGVRWSFTR